MHASKAPREAFPTERTEYQLSSRSGRCLAEREKKRFQFSEQVQNFKDEHVYMTYTDRMSTEKFRELQIGIYDRGRILENHIASVAVFVRSTVIGLTWRKTGEFGLNLV